MFRVQGVHLPPPPRCAVARDWRSPLLIALALIVAGCRGLASDWQEQPIAAGASPLLFEGGDFDPAQAEHLVQREARSSNQLYLSRLAGAETIAMLAALQTGPGYVVEERATESYVADLLPGIEPAWGESGRAPSRLGSKVPYRMFRLDTPSLSCVAFGQPVGQSADDRGRKRDLVFGYFCRAGPEPLSAATAEELIGKVALRSPADLERRRLTSGSSPPH
jgi:hypothetical protein